MGIFWEGAFEKTVPNQCHGTQISSAWQCMEKFICCFGITWKISSRADVPYCPPTQHVCHDFCQLHFSMLRLNFLIDGAIDSLLCNAVTENKHDRDLYTEKNEESNLNDVKKEDEVDIGEFDDIFSDSSESDNESLGQRLVFHL